MSVPVTSSVIELVATKVSNHVDVTPSLVFVCFFNQPEWVTPAPKMKPPPKVGKASVSVVETPIVFDKSSV